MMFRQFLMSYKAILQYRHLVIFTARQRLLSRNIETILGQLWLLIDPVFQITIYYFLFIVIFQSGDRYGINPVAFLSVGLVHFIYFQRGVTNMANSILGKQAMLQQVYLEPLIFVVSEFGRSLLEFLFAIAILISALWVLDVPLNANWYVYPFMLILLVVWMYCLGLVVATLTVFIRDVRNLSAMMLRLLMFACPIIYSIEFVPEKMVSIYLLNPLAHLFGLIHWSILGLGEWSEYNFWFLIIATAALFVMANLIYCGARRHFTKAF